MTSDEVQAQTQAHIDRVRQILGKFSDELIARGKVHDDSKLVSPEAEGFAKHTANLRGLTYGSAEYEAELAAMKPFLDHHYENNSHHPEFFENGISGMNLFDLVEMLADHLAACERHEDGCPYKSLDHNSKRFVYGPQLTSIFKNTLDSLARKDVDLDMTPV